MNLSLLFDQAQNKGQLFLKADDAKGDGKVTSFVASTPAPDRAEDIVAQDWNLDNFRANPVIMWAHQYDIPPVGRAITDSIGVDAQGNLRMDVQWDDSEKNELGQLMKYQYANGFMRAGSVGFRPTTVTPRSALPKEDARWGERGFVFGANELLEFSAAPIPMNAQALAAKMAKGFARPETMHTLRRDGFGAFLPNSFSLDSLKKALREDAELRTLVAECLMCQPLESDDVTLEPSATLLAELFPEPVKLAALFPTR
jgi:hypothetical protein